MSAPLQRVVRSAIPDLDADAIEARLAERRPDFTSSAVDREPSNAHVEALRVALADVESRLEICIERSAPRTTLPKRFARWNVLARALLAPYNYFSKPQREAMIEQTAALSSIVAILRMILRIYDDV